MLTPPAVGSRLSAGRLCRDRHAAHAATQKSDPIPPHRKQNPTHRRARATIAMRRHAAPPTRAPTRGARRRRHCGPPDHPTRLHQQARADRAGPVFVMRPFWRRSAELSSDGTSPRNALARAASPTEPRRIIERRVKRQRHHRPDAGRRHQAPRRPDQPPPALPLSHPQRRINRFNSASHVRQRRHHRAPGPRGSAEALKRVSIALAPPDWAAASPPAATPRGAG